MISSALSSLSTKKEAVSTAPVDKMKRTAATVGKMKSMFSSDGVSGQIDEDEEGPEGEDEPIEEEVSLGIVSHHA